MMKHTSTQQREVRPLVRSVPETAAMLNVSVRLVVKMLHDRDIESLKIRGRRMVPESAIMSYITREMERAAAD
jgi:excisionase family DNA binding protein